jgi:hypothetical protein
MGGSGVDRYEIEDIVVRRNIPLDAIAIKVSEEEALMPMKKEVLDAVPDAIENVKEILKRSKNRERVLIMGVGNTCGIGNSVEEIKDLEKRIKHHRETREEKKSSLKI